MALAIILGFMLITSIHSITYGALETVKTKAARYFSGHISITGYENRRSVIIDDPQELIAFLESSGLPIRTIAPRTVYYRTDASLFFGGQSVRQRRLVGIDFTAEQDELKNLDFQEGSLANMLDQGEQGILISQSAADILKARVGDDIMLYLTTDTGQYNTITLYVRGIFKETSLFGYVAYMRLEDLNAMLLRDSDSATDVALYADAMINHETLLDEVRVLLAEKYRLLPDITKKSDLNTELDKTDWSKGSIYAILTLDTHLDQITSLIDAFLVITWFILVIFVLIVMVGILNTYRVLIYDRIKEIGTLRALGMSRSAVRRMFLLEAALLAIVSSLIGLVLSIALKQVFIVINIGMLPGSGLFTDKGFLQPRFEIRMIGLNLFMMICAVTMAAFGPANKASRIAPADALNKEY